MLSDIISNNIQQSQTINQSQQQEDLQNNQQGDMQLNASSNSSLENNIDSFENRIRITYQDQIQSHSTQNPSRNQRVSQDQYNTDDLNLQISEFERRSVNLEEQRRIRNNESRNEQRGSQSYSEEIKRNLGQNICNSIVQFFFNYSLWFYLLLNMIVIINQIINKSNRNFTLIFWTVTSILFIAIRLIQTCIMYQREFEDFTNLMRATPSSGLSINRRSRISRLYPRRQARQEHSSSSINQIIQQNYLNDIENQNSGQDNNPSNIINSNLVSDEQRLRIQFQQIWLQTFRQQIQQQGANSNVLIIQQRSQQQQREKGLSKDEIKKFERVSFTYQEINKLTEQDIICSICLEKYECDKKLIKLPCNHIYHNHCITKWLLQDHKCPLCRTILKNSSS